MPGLRIEIDTASAERAARRLSGNLDTLGASASLNEREMQRLEARMTRGLQADIARSAMDDLGRSINLTRLETARLQAGIGDYGGALRTMTEGVGDATKKIALMGAAMSAAAVAGSMKLVDMFGEFESALNDMGKVTERSQSALRAEVMKMDPVLGSATDLMKGYYQTISAGVTDPVKSLNFLTTSAKAANAAHVEQGEVVKALSKLMAGYAGDIKTASTAADLLFSIEKEGQTSVAELVPVIGDLAAVSHEVGVSQTEMAGSLALLTQTSGSTSEAATKYKSILMSLYKPQAEMQKLLDKTGYASGVTMVKQLGLAGSLLKVKEEAAKSNTGLGKLIESQEALIGISALSANNFELLAEKESAVVDGAGSMDEAFESWQSTMEATKAVFGNTIGKLAIDFGEELAPAMQTGMEDFSNFISENRDDLLSFFKTIGTLALGASTQISNLAVVFEGTMQNVATNAAGFALATEGLISWTDYLTKSTDEIATMVSQFDKLSAASPGSSYKEWSISLAELTDKYKLLGAQIKRGQDFGTLTTEGEANLKGQQEAIQSQIDGLKKLLEVKEDLDVTIGNAEGWAAFQAQGVNATSDITKILTDAEKEILETEKKIIEAAGNTEGRLKKAYEKTLEYQLTAKKKELSGYQKYEDKKPEYVAMIQAEIAAIYGKMNSKQAAAYKKKLADQLKAVASFNAGYDKATLSSFEIQEKALKTLYDERLVLAEDGLISELELEEWFQIEMLKIRQAAADDAEKGSAAAIKLAEDEQKQIIKMQEQMASDLSGKSDYEIQKEEIEEYADFYIETLRKNMKAHSDISDQIAETERWKNLKIQELDEETAALARGQREDALWDIESSLTSIANLYEDGSKAQQAASVAANVVYAAEMAMLVQRNLMIAVGAVVNQGTGDPYTAIPRMAAMAAAVAGILSIANIDFSGGGVSGGDLGTEQRIGLVSGSGTVLGDDTIMSESLSNSFELLEDIEANQYKTLVDIFYEMQNLNSNITNLASSIVRDYGDFSADSFGVFEGTELSAIEKDLPGILTIGFADPLTNWVGDMLGGLAGDIFGGETSTKMVGSGFQLDPWSLAGGTPEESTTTYNYPSWSSGTLSDKKMSSADYDIDDIKKINNIIDTFEKSTTITETGKIISITEDDISKIVSEAVASGVSLPESLVSKAVESIVASASVTTITDSTQSPDVDTYQKIKTETDGGWFNSDKTDYETLTQDANEDTVTYFTKVLTSFADLAGMFSDELGVSSREEVGNYTFDLGQINLQDLTGEEIAETVQNVFSEVGDTMIEDLFGDSVKQYQEINEGLFETTIRLIAVKNVVSESFDKVGIAFDLTAGDAVKFSQEIIDVSGGLEEFSRSIDSFYDAFYSDKEKQTRFLDSAVAKIEALDVDAIFPRTEAEFKSLVQGLDLTTSSGQKLYTALLSMSDGAIAYYNYIDANAESVRSASRTISEAINGQLTSAQQYASWQIDNASALSLYIDMTAASVTRKELEGAINAFQELGIEGDDLTTIIGDLATSFSSAAADMAASISSIKSAQGILLGDGDAESKETISSVMSFFKNIPSMSQIRGDETIEKDVFDKTGFNTAVADYVVNSEFQRILGRNAEGDYWANSIINGSIPIDSLSDAIVNGIDNNEDIVSEIFNRLFGRSPNSSYWAEALTDGLVSESNIESAIIAGATSADLSYQATSPTSWGSLDNAATIAGILESGFIKTQSLVMSGEFSTSETAVYAAIEELTKLPDVIADGVINDDALSQFIETVGNMDSAVMEDIFGADAAGQISDLATAVSSYSGTIDAATGSLDEYTDALVEESNYQAELLELRLELATANGADAAVDFIERQIRYAELREEYAEDEAEILIGLEKQIRSANLAADAAEELADAEEKLIASRESALENVNDLINDIMGGTATGLSSVAYMSGNYNELYDSAKSDPGNVSDFTSFASEFLEFASDYGMTGATDKVLRDLETLDSEYSFDTGGVISGPMSGYTIPTTFHGVEHITTDSDMSEVKALLKKLVSTQPNTEIRVFIGNKELKAHTSETIRTDPETQRQIRRVARV